MNTIKYLAMSVALVMSCTAAQIFAADPANGQKLAKACSVCHGKSGIANDPMVPNVAGQSAMYLEKSLKEFRSGARQNQQMSLMAQNLSDDDIKDLAAWYASFMVEVTVPE